MIILSFVIIYCFRSAITKTHPSCAYIPYSINKEIELNHFFSVPNFKVSSFLQTIQQSVLHFIVIMNDLEGDTVELGHLNFII